MKTRTFSIALDLVNRTMKMIPVPASSLILQRNNKFLLVLRRNPPSADMYAFPGGRAEPGETPEQTALRECFEETGLQASNPRLFARYEMHSYHASGVIKCSYMLSVFTAQSDTVTMAKAADDAADLGWYSLDEIRYLPVPQSVLECVERLSLSKVKSYAL